MKCRAEIGVTSDQGFWVKRAIFLQRLDRKDFECREVQNIEDRCLAAWFCREIDGPDRFILSAFYLEDCLFRCINGRHRTAVLLQHLDEVPISVTNADKICQRVLKQINLRKLDENEMFELPDLPVVGLIDTPRL